ncbi:P-loop containing nucleoside triphosphate hydrolase protein [Suillus subluteus]|nr:P-loop containing nucleoside triphosphate hydrolase protein [Suillus subluteus]
MSLMTSNESNASEVTRDKDNDDDAIQQKSRKAKFISENGAIHQKLREAEIISDTEDTSPPPPNQLTLKNKISIIERNSLIALRVILGDDKVQWASPQQRQAVLATHKRETDIIAMLKTGGGKSMLAILPAIMEIDKALKAMRVPFQVYNQSHPLSSSINLTLVSADKARFKTWRQYLAELNEILPVSRMVFDEAHLALLSDEFRVSMQDLHELRQFSMQLILLTSTMPQSSVAALKTMFGLLPTAIEIRESINRPELEYIMRQPAQSNTLETKVTQIVEQEQKQWTTNDRGLVFVTYMEDGEINPQQTRWPFYNGLKNTSDAFRAQYYKDWRSGKTPVMICTSAFSTGNDYPHVRLVVHLKTPLEMSEIIQAQGRAGRDGCPARCYIVPSTSPPKLAIGRSEPDHKGRWYAHDYVYTHGLKRCLRYGSTLYIDGEGTKCKDDQRNQPCCVCKNDTAKEVDQAKAATQQQVHTRPKSSIHRRAISTNLPPLQQHTRMLTNASPTHRPTVAVSKRSFNDISGGADPFAEAATQSKKLKTAKKAEEMKRVDRMRNALNAMKDKGCTLCQASGEAEGQFHKLSRCPFWNIPGWSLGKYFEWKQEIRYNNHKGICWICHVPTCSDELHVPLVKGNGDKLCEWPDIILPLATVIHRYDDLKEVAEAYFMVNWATLNAFTSWLKKAPASGHHSNGMDLLLWYTEVHNGDA